MLAPTNAVRQELFSRPKDISHTQVYIAFVHKYIAALSYIASPSVKYFHTLLITFCNNSTHTLQNVSEGALKNYKKL